jgi:hypothetical protein
VLAIAASGREDELSRALTPLGGMLQYSIATSGFEVLALLEGHGPLDEHRH